MRPVALAVIAQIVNYLDAPTLSTTRWVSRLVLTAEPNATTATAIVFALTSLMEPVRIFSLPVFRFSDAGEVFAIGVQPLPNQT